MPYKDKEKQKEAVRKATQRYRKGITEQGITEEGITGYVTLSDGQVMDRAHKPGINPLSGSLIQAIRAANRANSEFKPNKGNRRALASIINKTTQSQSSTEKKEGQG